MLLFSFKKIVNICKLFFTLCRLQKNVKFKFILFLKKLNYFLIYLLSYVKNIFEDFKFRKLRLVNAHYTKVRKKFGHFSDTKFFKLNNFWFFSFNLYFSHSSTAKCFSLCILFFKFGFVRLVFEPIQN